MKSLNGDLQEWQWPIIKILQKSIVLNCKYQMHVYFAVIPGIEQGISDTLIRTNVALDQFCEDFPLASRVCIKSDNAGSYYRNCCFEVLYSIDMSK